MQRFDSEMLNFILDYELQHGNEVERIDEGFWTLGKLIIVMKKPLRLIDDSESRKNLDGSIEFWECRDTHYEVQAGFSCDETKEDIVAPIKGWTSWSHLNCEQFTLLNQIATNKIIIDKMTKAIDLLKIKLNETDANIHSTGYIRYLKTIQTPFLTLFVN